MNKRFNINYDKADVLNKKNREINILLKTMLGNQYIDLLNYKINEVSNKYVPYIYDNNHLSYYGTEQYKKQITKSITSFFSKTHD